MKIFLKLISVLIIVLVAVLASYNEPAVDFKIFNGTVHHLSLYYLLLATVMSGVTAGFCWAISLYIVSETKLKEYKRKLEKNTVEAECDNSKVSVLEAKIEVLEKALKSALENNND